MGGARVEGRWKDAEHPDGVDLQQVLLQRAGWKE